MAFPIAGAGARPIVSEGDYFYTKPAPTKVVCRAYDQAFPDGRLLTSIAKGTYLGPVEVYIHTDRFTAISVKGFWINVWTRKRGTTLGTNFAVMVPQHTVQSLVMAGWQVC